MGRHRTPQEKHELGERARALRADGRSRREIVAELRVGDALLSQLLQDTAAPLALRRPNAKDDVRARDVELRRSGATCDQIAAQLGVSKSSCSGCVTCRGRRRTWIARRRRRHDGLSPSALERHATGIHVTPLRIADGRRSRPSSESSPAATSSWRLLSPTGARARSASPGTARRSSRGGTANPCLLRLFLEGLAPLHVSTERLSLRLHIQADADEGSTAEEGRARRLA